eukprot:COSAG03_NODE_58_length_15674_cov_4.838909_7_plen_77_part_00
MSSVGAVSQSEVGSAVSRGLVESTHRPLDPSNHAEFEHKGVRVRRGEPAPAAGRLARSGTTSRRDPGPGEARLADQ